MKACFSLIGILVCTLLQGQYVFKGQVSEIHHNQNVYLSLVEDYRKTSRVYLNQIIQTTTADSLGYFSFEGNTLPKQNRIYRIHVDGCEEGQLTKNHFLRECASTESLLFIANNSDSITIPLLSGQAFCDLNSTNPVSGSLLEIEALKEEMILDFADFNSVKANQLQYNNWFKRFQEFGMATEEPLVELCVFDLLSDRKNETHAHYLETLGEGNYYDELLSRVKNEYPEASFSKQFEKELKADKNFISIDATEEPGFEFQWTYLLFPVFLLALIVAFVAYSKKRKHQALFSSLTPQELKVAEAILAKKTNKEIATELFISHSTVKTHVNNIYKKLGISSRQELQSKF